MKNSDILIIVLCIFVTFILMCTLGYKCFCLLNQDKFSDNLTPEQRVKLAPKQFEAETQKINDQIEAEHAAERKEMEDKVKKCIGNSTDKLKLAECQLIVMDSKEKLRPYDKDEAKFLAQQLGRNEPLTKEQYNMLSQLEPKLYDETRKGMALCLTNATDRESAIHCLKQRRKVINEKMNEALAPKPVAKIAATPPSTSSIVTKSTTTKSNPLSELWNKILSIFKKDEK